MNQLFGRAMNTFLTITVSGFTILVIGLALDAERIVEAGFTVLCVGLLAGFWGAIVLCWST